MSRWILGNEWTGGKTSGKSHFDVTNFAPFSSVSYMAIGRSSRRLPISETIDRVFFLIDRWLSAQLPRQLASFFTIKLIRRK
jgi:hypothetical protein